MDRIINVNVRGHYMTKDNNVAGAQGEGNATHLLIDFTNEWINLAKTVTFRNARGENPVHRTLTADLIEYTANTPYEEHIGYKVPIPGEAMTDFGMMGFVIDGFKDGVRARTVSDKLKVLESWQADDAGEVTDPTPTQAEQLQAQIDVIIQKVDAAIRAGEKLEGVLTLEEFMLLSQSYAVGGSGIREGEDKDNSKYYYDLCKAIAAGNTIIMKDDTTGELYRLGVDNGLLYIQNLGDDNTQPDTEGGTGEYIVSCDINENGELVFTTNTGKQLNAGVIPTGNHFVVRFSEMNGTYSADKTYAEVVAAMASDAVVTAKWQVSEDTAVCFMPVAVDSSCVTFQRDWLGESSEHFRLRADNTVTRQTFQYDAGGSDGASLFMVTLSSDDGETFFSNQTYAEIKAAVDAGSVVEAVWDNGNDAYRLQLMSIAEDYAAFAMSVDSSYSMNTASITTVLIMSDGSVMAMNDRFFYLPTVDTSHNDSALKVIGGVWTACATVPEVLEVTKDSASNEVHIRAEYTDPGADRSRIENCTIYLDENGDPTSVSKSGVVCSITWEGFDE